MRKTVRISRSCGAEFQLSDRLTDLPYTRICMEMLGQAMGELQAS